MAEFIAGALVALAAVAFGVFIGERRSANRSVFSPIQRAVGSWRARVHREAA